MSHQVTTSESKAVAVFAYAAGIQSFHQGDRNLVALLKESGFKPTVVQCGGLLRQSCPVIAADGILNPESPWRSLCCARCKSMARKWRRDCPDVSFIQLESLTDQVPSDENHNQSPKSSDDLTNLKINDMQALYSDLLLYKCNVETLLKKHPVVVRAAVNSFNTAQLAAKRLFNEGKYSACFVDNALYGTNRAIWEVAKLLGISTVNVHLAPDSRADGGALLLESEVLPHLDQDRKWAWRVAADIPLTSEEVQQVEAHLASSIAPRGRFQYSSAASSGGRNRVKLEFLKGRSGPIVLAVLSSPDERLSAEAVGALPNQDKDRHISAVWDFLQLIQDTAAMNPAATFVVRIHPRMGSNQRDRFESPFLKEILNRLSRSPENLIVNHPYEGLSLYDLAAFSSHILTMGSTAGIQLAALGMPVILCDPVYDWTVPNDVYFDLATTPKRLTEILNSATERNPVDLAQRAFRYLHFYIHKRAICIHELERSITSDSQLTVRLTFESGGKLQRLRTVLSGHFKSKVRQHPILKACLLYLRWLFAPLGLLEFRSCASHSYRVQQLILHNQSMDSLLAEELSARSLDCASDTALIHASITTLRNTVGLDHTE